MTAPEVTVVLPIHNGMPFLASALESILTQTLQDFRIIAINDGSTDGSADYLETISDERLSVIHREQAGLGAVLNLGIDLCKTPFIARMDADDISLPERFERQLACFACDPDLVAVGSPLRFLVHNKQQSGFRYPTDHDAIVRDLMRGESSFSHPTLMMRTAAASAIRYRIPGAGEDLDFCLRLSDYGKITNLETPQYLYRLHEGSVSMTKRAELECGYAYARHAAAQRRNHEPETPFQHFVESWHHRNIAVRVRSHLTSTSFTQYRKARLAWAREAYIESATHLGASLMLQPLRAPGVFLRKASPFLRSAPAAAVSPVGRVPEAPLPDSSLPRAVTTTPR